MVTFCPHLSARRMYSIPFCRPRMLGHEPPGSDHSPPASILSLISRRGLQDQRLLRFQIFCPSCFARCCLPCFFFGLATVVGGVGGGRRWVRRRPASSRRYFYHILLCCRQVPPKNARPACWPQAKIKVVRPRRLPARRAEMLRRIPIGPGGSPPCSYCCTENQNFKSFPVSVPRYFPRPSNP